MHGKYGRAFNIIELAVTLMLIGVVACLIIACSDDAGAEERSQRRDERADALDEMAVGSSSRVQQNNDQIRGIHEAMAIYAQSNLTGTSEGKFPGLDEEGDIETIAPISVDARPGTENGANPVVRYAFLLDRNLFSPDDAIAPGDEDKVAWDGGTLSNRNFSYAMLRITGRGGYGDSRRDEWAETLNSKAAVMSDRNIGGGRDQWESHDNQSIWSTSDHWEGSVVFNDNHAIFSETEVMEGLRYAHHTTSNDNLFATDGIAEMVYSDSSSLSQQH